MWKKRETFDKSHSTERLKGIREKIGGVLTPSTIVVFPPIDLVGRLLLGIAKSHAAWR
jgi:hypothetical protein